MRGGISAGEPIHRRTAMQARALHAAGLRLRSAVERSRAYGVQRLLNVPEQPMEGVISRLSLMESNLTTAGDGLVVLFLNWVVWSEHVCTANQNHPLALPIRFLAISFQWLPDRLKPAAVTVASSGCSGSRVAVTTTLNSDSVVAASCRRCG